MQKQRHHSRHKHYMHKKSLILSKGPLNFLSSHTELEQMFEAAPWRPKRGVSSTRPGIVLMEQVKS
uniref:Uncharacterized protein n=1 Tax=Arundo donax TaxID=35708 RepID=A0A0A8XX09_ARUDO